MLPFFLKQICIIGFYSINGNEIKFELRRGNPSIGERRKGGYTIVRLFFSGFLKKQEDNDFRRSIVLRIPDSIEKVVKPDF
jgi:hypothetical protein